MSKKRGLSLEEKRKAMLEIFYEKKEFFQLKDLEKIAPKEKGIVAQSVKDVLQSLVDDCMVDTEKIGTSVYFWSFPSKTASIRKQKLSYLEEKLDEVKKRKLDTEMKLNAAKVSRKIPSVESSYDIIFKFLTTGRQERWRQPQLSFRTA